MVGCCGWYVSDVAIVAVTTLRDTHVLPRQRLATRALAYQVHSVFRTRRDKADIKPEPMIRGLRHTLWTEATAFALSISMPMQTLASDIAPAAIADHKGGFQQIDRVASNNTRQLFNISTDTQVRDFQPGLMQEC